MKERFFEPFVDAVDGVMCVSAAADAADIAGQSAPHGLRFPLLLQGDVPLYEQVAASAFAPASSRFGPYCDNITGMNWELPDGRQVRIGERVVKSTTGYDLLRFLIGTGTRFGRPLDYVLRLRPACDGGGIFSLHGSPESLETAAAEILRSSFLHWFESVDWIEGSGESWLRIGVHCPKMEWTIFADFVSGLAGRHGLTLQAAPGDGQVMDGLPDLVLKTTPDRVIPLARKIANGSDVRCVAMCYCAAVHIYLPAGSNFLERITALIEPEANSLIAIGGDWQSRHLEPPNPCAEESALIERLEKGWSIAA